MYLVGVQSSKYIPERGVLEMFCFAKLCCMFVNFCPFATWNLHHQQFEIMSSSIQEYGNETDLVETQRSNNHHKFTKTKTNWIIITNNLESCKSVYDVYNSTPAPNSTDNKNTNKNLGISWAPPMRSKALCVARAAECLGSFNTSIRPWSIGSRC